VFKLRSSVDSGSAADVTTLTAFTLAMFDQRLAPRLAAPAREGREIIGLIISRHRKRATR